MFLTGIFESNVFDEAHIQHQIHFPICVHETMIQADLKSTFCNLATFTLVSLTSFVMLWLSEQ